MKGMFWTVVGLVGIVLKYVWTKWWVPYLKNIAIALDQLLNTILGGYPDETVSARAYRKKWLFRYVIDYTLFFWQKDQDGRRHCEQCYWYERERQDLPKEYRDKR